MEDKIEVGEWIRTEDGQISKNNSNYNWDLKETYINDSPVVKHSKQLIDLIEVGDYVNGYKVISVDYNVIDDKTECIELDLNNNYQYNFISARQIKTIITKEQMKSIEYKVEEDR